MSAWAVNSMLWFIPLANPHKVYGWAADTEFPVRNVFIIINDTHNCTNNFGEFKKKFHQKLNVFDIVSLLKFIRIHKDVEVHF